MDDLCWLNGTFLPLRDARVSVEDRGFNFADGVYEVFRLYPTGFFRLDSHLGRLRRSCAGIELALPFADEELRQIVDELAKRGGFASAMVYLQVTRGPAPRQHSFPVPANPTVMMSIKPLPAAVAPGAARGQKLITVADDRWQRCWIKSIALLPNILAKHAADRADADEALFVDGNIVQEGASSNVFIIRDGQLITSPIGAKVLPGVTREAILEIAESAGLLVVERGIELAELLTPGEAFISSTTRELAWISTINDKQIAGECGRNTRALHAAFQRLTCDRHP